MAELRARFQDKPDEKPDVLLLQEANAHDINLRGFILYSSPSISNNRPGQSADPPGKALVYIKEDWDQHQVDLSKYCDDNQEIVAVRTTVQRQVNVIFTSVYYRPIRGKKHNYDHGWIGHLHSLYPKEQKLYGGDFNLQHHLWGYDANTKGAEQLLGEMQAHRIQLVNKSGLKTRMGDVRQKDTTPDLT